MKPVSDPHRASRLPAGIGPVVGALLRAARAVAIPSFGPMLLAACAAGAVPSASPLPPSEPAELFFVPELEVDLAVFERTRSGLYVEDVVEGAGPVARRDSRVWIHYVGWLPDGTVFDSSVGGEPYHLRLGTNEVIRGWNEGIVGMKRGGERRLVVRPGLAYGSRGRGRIPPGSTLVFHIELVDVD